MNNQQHVPTQSKGVQYWKYLMHGHQRGGREVRSEFPNLQLWLKTTKL